MLCVVLKAQLAVSQENYVPGYIIGNDGDTLRGFIDYGKWDINPDRIRFKATTAEDGVFYNPIDIAGFGVRGQLYVSGVVDSEVSPRATGDLESRPQLNIITDTVFLQTLFKGEKSLYYHKVAQYKDNFYIDSDGGFALLPYKRYLSFRGGRQVIVENRAYLGHLSQYLNDCGGISTKLKGMRYRERNMVKLFQSYYDCSSLSPSFQVEMEKHRLELGVLGGTSWTSVLFFKDVIEFYDYLAEIPFEKSMDFSGGVFADWILARSQGRISIYTELLYTTFAINGSHEYVVTENDYTIRDVELAYNNWKINLSGRYSYPVGRLHLFANLGAFAGIFNEKINRQTTKTKYYGPEQVNEGYALIVSKRNEWGTVFGVGARYGRFSLEYRRERGGGISPVSNSKTQYVLLGFRFWKSPGSHPGES